MKNYLLSHRLSLSITSKTRVTSSYLRGRPRHVFNDVDESERADDLRAGRRETHDAAAPFE